MTSCLWSTQNYNFNLKDLNNHLPGNWADYWVSADEIDELLSDNRRTILKSIADELRVRLPPNAMFPSERTVHSKVMQQSFAVVQRFSCRISRWWRCSMVQMQRLGRPTLHVDSFLYDEDQVDSLCEAGTMSRSFCLTCGSYRTAPLGQNTSTTIFWSSTLSHPADSCLLLLQISFLTPSPSQSFSLFSRRFCQTWMAPSWWMWAQDWELSCMGSVCLKQGCPNQSTQGCLMSPGGW